MNMISDNLIEASIFDISIFDRGINICLWYFWNIPILFLCYSRQSMKLNYWQIDIKSQALQIFTTKEIFRNIRLRCSGIIVETTIIELSRRQNDWQKILVSWSQVRGWYWKWKAKLEEEEGKYSRKWKDSGTSNETQVSPFLTTSRKQEILEPERNWDSLLHKCGSKQSKNSSDWVRRLLEELLTG